MAVTRSKIVREYATITDLDASLEGETQAFVADFGLGLGGKCIKVGGVWRPAPGEILAKDFAVGGLEMFGGGTSKTGLTVGALTKLFEGAIIPDWWWPSGSALVVGVSAGYSSATSTATADVYALICATEPTATAGGDYPMAYSQAAATTVKGLDASQPRVLARSGAILYGANGLATPTQGGLSTISPSKTVTAPANWSTGAARLRIYGKAGATENVYRVYGWFIRMGDV